MKPARRALLPLLLLFVSASTLFVAVSGCASSAAPESLTESDSTPAADSIGEALFVDTRFAQFFAEHMTGVNAPLATGDPVVAKVQTLHGTLPGPFAGQSMNCRSCHFVTEFQGVAGAGNRTYADFTTHSPMPRMQPNGLDHTPRNSLQMVGSFTRRSGQVFLHSDGEFTTGDDLVSATLTGRNFGWMPTQYKEALAHIARVIREDDGSSQLAADRLNGLSYAVLFKGTDPRITSDLQLGPNERLDASTATDEQIVAEVAHCITTYMQDLLFQQDKFQRYIGSPYDNFLRVNHLPQNPLAGESRTAYNQRLLSQIEALSNPIYITPADGSFLYHKQDFKFGAQELAGLKIFLSSASEGAANAHAGNCGSCHQAPDFSDFTFHNTGVTQAEYDGVHGAGSFMNLLIPSQAQRVANFNAYLPASAAHPNAIDAFRRPADAGHPQYTDLGLWNVYMNPDMPKPQAALKAVVCASGNDCSMDQGLANTIARFRTPMLRDLEDSAPYFHNGGAVTFDDVVKHYIAVSLLARQGMLRNPPAEFAHMSISQDDLAALVAFLKSLTEDYDDA